MDIANTGMVLSKQRITKVLIRLCGCMKRFSHDVAQIAMEIRILIMALYSLEICSAISKYSCSTEDILDILSYVHMYFNSNCM